MERGIFTKRAFQLAALAAVLAGIAAFLILGSLIKKVDVVVARSFIPAGVEVKAEWLKKVSVDVQSAHGLRSEKEIIGKRLKSARYPGDQISAQMLGDEKVGELTGNLDRSMRAISIPVDPVEALGWKVQAGDLVDVVAVYGGQLGSEIVAETILRGAQVLDVGKQGDEVQPVKNSYVTLAVTQRDAQKISMLSEIGSFRLVGRPADAIDEPLEITVFAGGNFNPAEASPLQPQEVEKAGQ